jgi:hypothetical protein
VAVMRISKFTASGNGADSTAFAIGSYAIAGIIRSLWTPGGLRDADGKPSALR